MVAASVALCMLAGAATSHSQQTRPSDAAVCARMDTVDLTQPIPLSIDGLDGMKLAFQTKGTADAHFTLHDDSTNKDLRPARGVWKLTGTSPHVAGYQWAGGNWAPCLYRMDLFGQDAILWRKVGKPREGQFTRLDFAKISGRETLQVRDIVVYRGDDTTPPEAPAGLKAEAGDTGVRLTWKAAKDNIGVAWYVVSRATGSSAFTKIGQTADLEFADRPPAPGAYRYCVLAADYERNLGPWSSVVAAQSDKGFDQAPAGAIAQDARWYAAHICAIHAAGEGKVRRCTILFHGDGLHYLDRLRNFAAGLEGLLTHSCFNESSQVIRPGNPSSKLVKELEKELELRPEFCMIGAGLEDVHPKPFPEDEHTTPEDRKRAVDNVLAMVRMCEAQGTVAIVATLTPFGHTAPKGSPEEKLSDELAAMCEANQIPVVRVFDLFRKVQEAGEDYTLLMKPLDMRPMPNNPMWSRGYEFLPYEPTFELGITERFIVVKETLDQVLFTLMDRPE